MQDACFDSSAWFAFRTALVSLSPVLAPRLFQVTVSEEGAEFRLWWPALPDSSAAWTLESMDDALPFLVDGETPPSTAPIRTIEELLERADLAGTFQFTALRRTQAGGPSRVAVILRVRREGLPDALGLEPTSYVDAEPPVGDALEVRGTLFRALIHRGLYVVDFERLLGIARAQVEERVGAHRSHVTPTELLRRSAGLALERALRSVGLPDFVGGGALFHRLEELSKRDYERRGAAGAIRFARTNPQVSFAEPIRLVPEQMGAARKALEMSDAEDRRFLISQDGQSLQGIFEEPGGATEGPTERALDITFDGPQRWSCCLGSRALFQVVQGVPRPPTAQLSQRTFSRWLRLVFGDALQVETLWPVVEPALSSARHGSLLVFCRDVAVSFPHGLGQSFAVTPCAVPAALLPGFFDVDGAVIFDLQGICHAAGLILDGPSVQHTGPLQERRERGARFNSAVRFVASNPSEMGALVVSEDGPVTLLPALPDDDDPYRTDMAFLAQHDGRLDSPLRPAPPPPKR